jgi:transcription-repair coupling factor (superfamily II helicase)
MPPTPDDLQPSLLHVLEEERALAAYKYPLDEVVAHLKSGSADIQVSGSAWIAIVLQAIQEKTGRPMAVVTPRLEDARLLHDAFTYLTGHGTRAHLLLPPDVSPYGDIQPDRQTTLERLHSVGVLGRLSAGEVMIAPAVAWARKVLPQNATGSSLLHIAVGDSLDFRQLRDVLLGAGYSAAALVEDAGTFSIRGDRLDIFSPEAAHPVRIECYGDIVDSMRTFDQSTQRGLKPVDEASFSAVREELLTEATVQTARGRLFDLGGRLGIPSNRVSAVIKDLQERRRFFGIEGYLPALADALQSPLERLPDDTLMVMWEPDRCAIELGGFLEDRQTEYEREAASGKLCFAPSEFYSDADELRRAFDQRAPRLTASRGAETALRFPALENQDIVRLRKAKAGDEGAVRAVIERLTEWRELFGRIVIVCGTRGGAERLGRLFEDYDVRTVLHPTAPDLREVVVPPAASLEIAVGHVRDGFRSPAHGVALLTDSELLGRATRRASKDVAHETTVVSSFSELHPGDLVVHVDHGVARYQGLERMDVGGYQNDFLVLEYADSDKLYLPVYRLGRVQKYVGSAAFGRLDKLGGTSWEKTRERVKRQLADIAAELLEVQARRKTARGFQFSEPNADFHAFEAAFPYEETTGQAQAISEVLDDMQSEQPMDRLLCGDVGFGKTEVAIRAAYKAVLDGKQVAMLVPTTVLAEQHLSSFRNRLSGTPAVVECVSRFRTPNEVKDILQRTAAGKVDVLIGTHRILSADVKFADLGLLLVDEEQRFGVVHKEKIKQLRAGVDVLTMSATPIPRTLEMSLLGIRDLSMITTPPAGRLAVRTHLAKFTDAAVREAVQNELQRGGQVFFVHNRVETIYNVADRIQQAVPEAKVIVGHAQMRDIELEDVMMRFLERKANVLVSTTIIESGLDVASANTIFVNNAHMFGLSQLHQLRGRVGRGSDRAFCYLLVDDPRKLTDEARRRLEVIQEHSDLGSGLQIAHQDLDLRGAGNILGRDQAGHIESIGFELFSELLEEAIADLKGEPVEAAWDPEVKLPVGAYIPESYLEDVSQRLAFYKRLSMAQTDEQLFDIHGELEDRYGDAPREVTNLRDIISLKLGLRRIRGKRIEGGPRAILVELMPDTPVNPDRVMQLLKAERGRYTFRPGMILVRTLKPAEGNDLLTAAHLMIRDLESCL